MMKAFSAPLALTLMAVWSLLMTFVVRTFLSLNQPRVIPNEAWLATPSSPSWSSRSSSIVQTRRIVPLDELAGSHNSINCPEGLMPVYDTLLHSSMAFAEKRKIPRIIHLTSKSRCLHPHLHANVEKWRLKDHSFFFHDDEAMDKLLYRDWPEFPQLKYVIRCLLYGGAVKADLWRVLVLWEYGGIYADFDTSPKPHKFNESTITADDDGFFVIEYLGAPSQWFMAVSPRHPIMYCTMMSILINIQMLDDIGHLPIVWTTGPGALIQGWNIFMGPGYTQADPLVAGTYSGAYGRSARLVGSQADENEYLERNIYEPNKKVRDFNSDRLKNEVYKSMGMAHITTSGSKDPRNRRNESCFWRMWRNEMQDALIWEPSW